MGANEPRHRRKRPGACAGWLKRLSLLSVVIAVGVLPLSACANSAPSPFNPSSPRAQQLSQLGWIFFAMAAAIFLAVVVIMLYGAFRVPAQGEQENVHPFGTPLIWVGGITIPLIVLGIIFLLSTRVLASFAGLSPTRLTIEVIGHQWWWEVRYPQHGFVTANEIHIPTGRQVEVKLTSDDTIHDFWVPELQGKIDAIPGETNTLTLETGEAGTYRGECLVFCGLQHANMNFLVVADPPDQFNAWLAGQQATPAAPADATLVKGQQIFLGSACIYCHGVKGTNASARVGPDLTHFGSRQQLAAGTVPNNPSTLRGWIVNPQTIKPGNLMPPENFSDAELQELIAYIESLK